MRNRVCGEVEGNKGDKRWEKEIDNGVWFWGGERGWEGGWEKRERKGDMW